MPNLGRIAIHVKSLAPTDSVTKAAEAVRASTVGAVPVVDRGMLLGLVTGGCLARFLTEYGMEAATGRTVAELELERATPIPETVSAADALYYFRSEGLSAAPVVDYAGGLVGMVSEAELVSAAVGRGKLPLIGGMATPFGVYLTGGGVRGGVNDFALMTTGMFMGAVTMVSVHLGAWLTNLAGPLLHISQSVERWPAPAQVAWVALPQLLLFGLLFRLSWITGYHAAEHQTVHVLEAGEDLRPEAVARMPRVHPRCGTNIVAAVSLMTLLLSILPVDAGGVPIAMLVTAILWRRVGGFLQQYVTTRPATRKQLESGIKAATELIDRYENGPPVRLTLGRRLWNMGLFQVTLGYLMVSGVYLVLMTLLGQHPLANIF